MLEKEGEGSGHSALEEMKAWYHSLSDWDRAIFSARVGCICSFQTSIILMFFTLNLKKKLENNVEKHESMVCKSYHHRTLFLIVLMRFDLLLYFLYYLFHLQLMLICVPVYMFCFSGRHSLVLVDEEELLLLFRALIFLSNCVPTVLCLLHLQALFILLLCLFFFYPLLFPWRYFVYVWATTRKFTTIIRKILS